MNELKKIKEIIETITGIDDLANPTRDNAHSVTRAIYYTLARRFTSYSLTTIAEVVGKTHASVLNGMKALPQYLRDFPQYREVYEELEEINFNLSYRDILTHRERMQQLKQKVVSLTRELHDRRKVSVPDSHRDLLQMVNGVPEQHVDNVIMRLKPIIRMLPKTHN